MKEQALDPKNSNATPAGGIARGLLQRKCACGTHTIGGIACGGCDQKKQTLQRHPARAVEPMRLTDKVPSIVDETLRSSGQPLDSATRSFMEPRFKHDFSQVRVHTDARAAESARAVNALAYTVGRDIVFEAGRYAPGTETGRGLIAHELAHVIQQRRGGGASAQGKATGISQPGDAAERRADVAAEAVLHDRSVPDVGDASAGTIHRVPVRTNGGAFDTTAYAAVNNSTRANAAGVGKIVGAHIELTFTPNTLVVADNIGLTQTVNTLTSTAAGGAVTSPSFVGARNQALSLTAAEGEEGRAIDQGDPGDADTIPNTSPLYTVENTPGSVATTLTDVGANFGQHAFRKLNADGRTFNVQQATLSDTPRRGITFAGQQFNQKFEAAALVLDGPMANTYLGAIEWGWHSDAAGVATLDPDPIRMVSAGAPTTAFMNAATKWNAATFTDPTSGTVHNTVNLPVLADDLHSGSTRAAERGTGNLIAWINMVNFQISNLPAGVERTNKEFERRALTAELSRRSLMVDVRVIRVTSGPGDDDVYVKVTRGGRSVRTRVRELGDGSSTTFAVPLQNLMPIDGPITVEVYDEDDVSADDLIVRMSNMRTPLEGGARVNTESLDGADYRVTVRYDR